MTRRERLDELTDRWRRRHEARRSTVGGARPMASPQRQELAARVFPYRSVPPVDYVAAHGPEMTAFTYDDERYDDSALDDWIVEVGALLRELRNG